MVPDLHLTLQREATGACATDLIDGPRGVQLMGRIAEAIHALHASGVPARRCHGMQEELDILRERLVEVGRLRPDLERRLCRIFEGCERLGATLQAGARTTGIHRDFYADQVIVEGDDVTLLDLDLHAMGDPALDVGNFGGHLVEQALRVHGDPQALRGHVDAFFGAYCELADGVGRAPLEGYATLTLARHIQISTRIAERRHTTDALVDLCESRLRAHLGSSRQRFKRSRSVTR